MEKAQEIVLNNPDRIDRALTEHFPGYSRSYFQQLIQQNCVSLNGAVIRKSSMLVKAGDTVLVLFPAVKLPGALPISTDLGAKLLYEHEDFLIVYKPASLIVHAPNLYDQNPTLVDWLIHSFRELEKVGYADRPGIVHRLDKDTSGILIVPRNNSSHATFSALFQHRLIEKKYRALVSGHLDQKGTIDFTVGRDSVYKHKMAANVSQGRDALTHYTVIEYFKDTALIEVHPITGRTHQIRVHCSAIGHPIVGDTTYGTPHQDISRQALHAYQLSFTYKDIYYSFWHDMPIDMQELIAKLRLDPCLRKLKSF